MSRFHTGAGGEERTGRRESMIRMSRPFADPKTETEISID